MTRAQTTTANMPKIYDGTTGVVTDNGKPAVEFSTSGTATFNMTTNLTSIRSVFHVSKSTRTFYMHQSLGTQLRWIIVLVLAINYYGLDIRLLMLLMVTTVLMGKRLTLLHLQAENHCHKVY